MKKKKDKKKSLTVCKYCSFFSKAKRISVEMDDESNRLFSFRKCPVNLKSVGEEDPSCEKFELAPLFWCKKCEQWMYVTSCFSRREKGEEGCVRCQQGTLLMSIV